MIAITGLRTAFRRRSRFFRICTNIADPHDLLRLLRIEIIAVYKLFVSCRELLSIRFRCRRIRVIDIYDTAVRDALKRIVFNGLDPCRKYDPPHLRREIIKRTVRDRRHSRRDLHQCLVPVVLIQHCTVGADMKPFRRQRRTIGRDIVPFLIQCKTPGHGAARIKFCQTLRIGIPGARLCLVPGIRRMAVIRKAVYRFSVIDNENRRFLLEAVAVIVSPKSPAVHAERHHMRRRIVDLHVCSRHFLDDFRLRFRHRYLRYDDRQHHQAHAQNIF